MMGATKGVARKFGGGGGSVKGVFAEVNRVGGAKGLGGNHWKQTKGVPGTQKVNQESSSSSSSSHVQLI